jgi:hypothetical protein
MKKAACADGMAKRVQMQKSDRSSDDGDSNSDYCSSLSRERAIAARIHPFQEILEQHGEYGYNYSYDVGEKGDNGSAVTAPTSSTKDAAVPSSEESLTLNDLVKIQSQALETRDVWRGLEDAIGRELEEDDDDNESAQDGAETTDDAASPSASEEDEEAVDTRGMWRGLEEALYEEFAAEFETDEESSTEHTRSNDSADTNNRQPRPDAEELMNAEAIENALNNDIDEILSENAAIATTILKDDVRGGAASITDDEEQNNDDENHDDNTRDTIRPGAHHIYPEQPITAEDSREDDQNEIQQLDDSDVVYDLFHELTTPHPAEVIPEVVRVDLSSVSFDYCANVNSAAVVSQNSQLTLMYYFIVKCYCLTVTSSCLLYTQSHQVPCRLRPN